MTGIPESDEIAGLLAAIPNLEGDAQRMALDALLDRLERTAPEVAKIVATVICALDPSTRRAIEKRFTPYQGHRPMDGTDTSLVDCLILTIKEVERRAVLAAFDVPMSSYSWIRDLPLHVFDRDDRRFAIASVGVDGNSESAIMFGRLYQALHPRASVLIGMAGGVAGKVKVGDVVVAQHVHAYDFQKLTEDGRLNRSKTYRVPDRLIRQSESMLLFDRSWFSRVARQLRDVIASDGYATNGATVPDENWQPNVVLGDILAGGSLVEDGSLPEWARGFNEKVKAAEMEGAGFAAACDEAATPWMAIRGVADVGERDRQEDWQFGSTFVAASWLRTALRLRMVELTPPSGG